MRCVMSALAAAHEAGICYGDVKPANFMLSNAYPAIAHLLDPSKPKGELAVKAVDFGCAQWCPDGCALLQGLSGTPGARTAAALFWPALALCACLRQHSSCCARAVC